MKLVLSTNKLPLTGAKLKVDLEFKVFDLLTLTWLQTE